MGEEGRSGRVGNQTRGGGRKEKREEEERKEGEEEGEEGGGKYTQVERRRQELNKVHSHTSHSVTCSTKHGSSSLE